MKRSKLVMIASSVIFLGVFLLPIWNITLEAPQYPTPIGMNIHVNKLSDANPNDIKNINLMNHYVGMKEIPDHLPEFDLFPYLIITMASMGVIFGFIGKRQLFMVWLIIMLALCVVGMYDFWLWEYDYGHTLDPKAAIQFTNPDGTPMAYQPPLIGTKTILNFVAHSYPRSGVIFLIISMAGGFWAYLLGKKEALLAS